MIILFLIQYVLLNQKVNSIIVLPFEITGINHTNTNYSINNLIYDLFYRDIYTNLYVGTPPQEMLTLIRPDNQTLFFNSKDCNRKKLSFIKDDSNLITKKSFNGGESNSFYKLDTITTINNDLNTKEKNYLYSDTISFYDSNCLHNLNNNQKCKTKITVDKFNFMVEISYTSQLCGRLGMGYSKFTQMHFVKQLKKKKGISNYLMTLQFLEDEKGYLILGGYPHEYEANSKYDSNNLVTINTGSKGNIILPWSVSFIRTYLKLDETNEILVQKYALCYLVFNFGLIKGTEKYKNLILQYFFQDLINKDICKMELTEKTIFDRKASSINSNGTFTMFICNKKLFTNNYIKKFPPFKLKHDTFGYIFELTYEDLFKEINDKYYFLIIFPEDHALQWIFGIPFLKKYQFIYDYDSYTIGYYPIYNEKNLIEEKENNKNNQNNQNKNNSIIMNNNNFKSINFIFIIPFIIIFCILLIFIGYLIRKKLYEKRKRKANELEDDDYEYFSYDKNNNNDDKSNSLLKQNYIKNNCVSNYNKIMEMSTKI